MDPREGSPWLDVARFPGRRYLLRAADRKERLPDDGLTYADRAPFVQRTWAARIGCQPDDLVLCASDAEAWNLLLGALLLPGDVAVIAEPAPNAAVATVLAKGAAYVDVGRRSDGAVEPAALQLALGAHRDTVAVLEAPGLFGSDDRSALPVDSPLRPRALIVDATHASGWGLPPPPRPDALAPLATVLALRDPDALGAPVLYAVVAAPDTGPALALLQPPPRWPPNLLRRAADVLAVLEAPAAVTAAERALAKTSDAFAAALAGRPGVVVHPRAGWRQAAECLGGDAVQVAAAIRPTIAPVESQGPEPRRTVVWLDLGAATSAAPAAQTLP